MLLIKWKVDDGDSLKWTEYKFYLHTTDHIRTHGQGQTAVYVICSFINENFKQIEWN
jgi:hypothetical protein